MFSPRACPVPLMVVAEVTALGDDLYSFKANNEIGPILNLLKYTHKCSLPELVQCS